MKTFNFWTGFNKDMKEFVKDLREKSNDFCDSSTNITANEYVKFIDDLYGKYHIGEIINGK